MCRRRPTRRGLRTEIATFLEAQDLCTGTRDVTRVRPDIVPDKGG